METKILIQIRNKNQNSIQNPRLVPVEGKSVTNDAHPKYNLQISMV